MPVNVLYLNSVPYIGGAELSLLTLMRHLDKTRYNPYLVTCKQGMLSAQADEYNIPTFFQSFPWFSRRRPWTYVNSVWHLVRTIQRNNISLVHTNCDRSLCFARWACRFTNVPYVSHVRDCVRSWFRAGNLAALNRARCVIANARALADAFVEAGVKSELIEVAYNPVDIAQYSQIQAAAVADLRRSLGISPGAYVVGLVGQVQSIKGQEDLVRAASRVVKLVSNAQFLVVGDAQGEPAKAYLRYLKKLVGELRLDAQVHFLGFRDDIPIVMQAIDVLVVPSRPEHNGFAGRVEKDAIDNHQPFRLRQIGFGRVVIEGMAAGCAVVATHLEGMTEILEHKHNGLLIAPGDVRALAEAIILLAQDTELRERIAAGGRQTAQQFGAERHADKVQVLYDAVMRQARGS